MSSPESVSSSTANVGSSTDIWRISLRFFSPPENPAFTGRRMSSGSKSSSSTQRRMSSRKSTASSSGSPRCFLTSLTAAFRK